MKYFRHISIVAMALSALTYIDFQRTEEDAISKFQDIISSSKLFFLSVLLNCIANYDSNYENIVLWCI